MMRDIAFGASGKVENFQKANLGVHIDNQSTLHFTSQCFCQWLLLAIKSAIGDGQAAIHIGLANGKIRLEQNTPEPAVIL